MTHHTGAVPDTEPAGQWLKQAACREDPDRMFPGTLDAEIEYAKRFCDRCPVVQQCGEWALATREPFGVWGGMSEAQRRNLLRRRGRGTRPRPARTEPPTTPAATLGEAFQRRTIPLAGGHLAWTGTRQVTFRGTFYTPKRAAFIADRGRQPQGPVLPMCGVEECVLPAHFTDDLERKEQGLPDPRRRAECGTRSGYQRHVKRGEPIDDACRQANTDADNRLRRTGTTKAHA